MKSIGATTSEVLHSQSEAGRLNEQTNCKTICFHSHTIICGASILL